MSRKTAFIFLFLFLLIKGFTNALPINIFIPKEATKQLIVEVEVEELSKRLQDYKGLEFLINQDSQFSGTEIYITTSKSIYINPSLQN